MKRVLESCSPSTPLGQSSKLLKAEGSPSEQCSKDGASSAREAKPFKDASLKIGKVNGVGEGVRCFPQSEVGSSEGVISGSGRASGGHGGAPTSGRKSYSPLPLPSPPPLDRSAYIPREFLPVREGMESIFEFAARFSPELAATGLARCTVKVPSLAAYETAEPESILGSMQLLERVMGKNYKMHSYSCA